MMHRYDETAEIYRKARTPWRRLPLAAMALTLTILVAPGVVAFAADSTEATRSLIPAGHATGQSAEDQRVAEVVFQSLSHNPNTRIDNLRVEVQAGITTLYGQVHRSADKHLASRYADDVPGVVGVVNALDVQPVPPPKNDRAGG